MSCDFLVFFSCKLILHEFFEFFESFHVNKWVVWLMLNLMFCLKMIFRWYWRQSIKMQKNRNLHVILTINVEKNSHYWKYVKSSIHVDIRFFFEYAYFLFEINKVWIDSKMRKAFDEIFVNHIDDAVVDAFVDLMFHWIVLHWVVYFMKLRTIFFFQDLIFLSKWIVEFFFSSAIELIFFFFKWIVDISLSWIDLIFNIDNCTISNSNFSIFFKRVVEFFFSNELISFSNELNLIFNRLLIDRFQKTNYA